MAEIVWSPSATDDLRRIHARISRDSLTRADKWFNRIMNSIRALGRLPEIGSPVDEFRFSNLREQIVGPFRVLYRVNQDECRLIRIVRAEQDLGRILSSEELS